MKKYSSFDKSSTQRVSYILNTKNRAEFLEQTLKMCRTLIKNQDELIIIDGASEDNTPEVVKKYADIIDIFLSEPDLTSAHAFNKGLLLAKGRYIKHLADDDIVLPQALEKAILVMEKNPEIDLLVCGGTVSIAGAKSKKIVYVPPGSNYGHNIYDIFDYGACGMGYIIRRDALSKIGLFPAFDWLADASFLINCIQAKATVKFCRINLFHAMTYPHSTGTREAKGWDQDKFNLVKNYAPKSFFWRYRINRYLWQHPKYKFFFIFPLTFLKILKRITETRKKYVWDGGFS
ncbi:glycosyltransferase [Candidatus Daviesbacteria bacterium]|nr:glycosyltransferase [Candidatus Daviesbacteria bacterium]